MTNKEFIRALHTYQDILKQIYKDIIKNPENFGMPCLAVDSHKGGPLNKDEKKSRTYFFRLPQLLLTMGQVGEIRSGHELEIDIEALKSSKVPMKSIKLLLINLKNYGFEFSGVDDNFNLNKTEKLIVHYPDDRTVLKVLKAFGYIKSYERFIAADYRDLLSHKGQREVYAIDDVIRTILKTSDQELLKNIHHKLLSQGYKSTIEYAGFFSKVKYYKRKSRDHCSTCGKR